MGASELMHSQSLNKTRLIKMRSQSNCLMLFCFVSVVVVVVVIDVVFVVVVVLDVVVLVTLNDDLRFLLMEVEFGW